MHSVEFYQVTLQVFVYDCNRNTAFTEISQYIFYLFLTGGVGNIFFHHSVRVTSFHPTRITIFQILICRRNFADEEPRSL
jgi:hypothetical protein